MNQPIAASASDLTGPEPKTFHYTQTQYITNSIANGPNGKNAEFVGHSLGRGLAAAAAQSIGRPATTFNAAGLPPDTVERPVCAQIDAVQIRGEMLTTLQHLPFLAVTQDTTVYSLAAPSIAAGVLVGLGALGGMVTLAAALVYRAYKLHGMASVMAGLRDEVERVDAKMEKAGCQGPWKS